MKEKRICTFTFGNDTQLIAAISDIVDGLDNNGRVRYKDFSRMYHEAKSQCEINNEGAGRGGIVSFKIGDYICT